MARLQQVTDALTGEHPVAHWLETITEGVGQLTAVARDEEWQLGQLHRELAGLAPDPGPRAWSSASPTYAR